MWFILHCQARCLITVWMSNEWMREWMKLDKRVNQGYFSQNRGQTQHDTSKSFLSSSYTEDSHWLSSKPHWGRRERALFLQLHLSMGPWCVYACSCVCVHAMVIYDYKESFGSLKTNKKEINYHTNISCRNFTWVTTRWQVCSLGSKNHQEQPIFLPGSWGLEVFFKCICRYHFLRKIKVFTVKNITYVTSFC